MNKSAVRNLLHQVRRLFAPAGSRRENLLRRLLSVRLLARPAAPPAPAPESLSLQAQYAAWVAANEPDETDLAAQRLACTAWQDPPLVSIILALTPDQPAAGAAAVRSVLAQTCPYWQLVLSGPAAALNAVRAKLGETADDPRLTGWAGEPGGDLDRAKGKWLALLEPGAALAPFAVYEALSAVRRDPALELVYSDEDWLDGSGARGEPFFKPGWSPELLLSVDYLSRWCVFRRALFERAGNITAPVDDAARWDLSFRLQECAPRALHLPQVLYHRPAALRQPAPALWPVEAHLQRLGLASPRAWFASSGAVQVSWTPPAQPRVSIIIPTRGAPPMLETCLNSLLALTRYPDFEVLVLNNGEKRPEAFPYFASLQRDPRVQVHHLEGPFNYSAANNAGARLASGGLLLFLNNDTQITESGWLAEMAAWALRPEIGAVGARLARPDQTIQHAGIILGLTGFAGHIFAGAPAAQPGPFGSSEWYRDFLALTAACLMIRKELFVEQGGFKEEFLLCGNDVELGLRLYLAGYRNVYTPYARLLHLESATHRGEIPARDFETSFRYYAPFLRQGDPYFSPNLSCWEFLPAPRRAGEPAPYDFARAHLDTLKEKS